MQQIPGFPGYLATPDGRIWSTKGAGRYLKPAIDSRGYRRVSIRLDGKSLTRTVHTLIALTYLGPRPDGLEICHNDGDPMNNSAHNLRYDTHSSNMLDKAKHGTNVSANAAKTHCPKGHEYTPENTYRYNRHRICKTCNREWGAAQYAKKVGRPVRKSGGGLREYI